MLGCGRPHLFKTGMMLLSGSRTYSRGGLKEATPKEEDGAYWVQIQKPLPGVHLICFTINLTDTHPKVLLRVWVLVPMQS